MLRSRFTPFVLAVPTVLAFALVACGGESETAPPPPAPTYAPPPPVATTPAPVEAPKAEPTAEEKKKAADAQALADDRAAWEAAHKAELARWTPELHAEAKALAEKSYPNAKAALTATIAGKHRAPDHVARDKYRHPLETLEFFGFKPNMTVIDVGPGDGWYTEILAPALAKNGKYIGTAGGDPNGPPEKRSTFYAQRWKGFLDTSPELYGKVETRVVDSKAPQLGPDNSADMVLIMRGLHGMKDAGTLPAWLADIHRVLKPNGVLGIEEHRAKDDANPDESAKKGYVPQKFVIDTIEAAGFKLAGKSEINANPKDTKDWPEGVWTLPPTLRLKDQDRDKYVAVGESDRMTLKFVKVATKPAAAAKPATKADEKKPAPKADTKAEGKGTGKGDGSGGGKGGGTGGGKKKDPTGVAF